MKNKLGCILSDKEIKNLQNWIPLDFKFGTWSNCFYCGAKPDSQDHIVPWSMINVEKKHKGSDNGPRTPSCMSCNLILSSLFFDSLKERCDYLKRQLQKKYAKILKNQDWSDEELKELKDGKIKNYIIQQMNIKKEVFPKVYWQNSNLFISEFDKAYKKSLIEYPNNKKLHEFMTPNWHLMPSNND